MKNNSDASEKKTWTVRDAKVNLAALLNDPRKVRRDYDLFTKTWGDHFKEPSPGTSIPKSIKVPKVSHAHFTDYLTETSDSLLRHQSQRLSENQNASSAQELLFTRGNAGRKKSVVSKHDNALKEQKRIQAATRQALDSVPKLFIRSDFALEDHSIFNSVMNLNGNTHQTHRMHKTPIEMSSSKLLQEKLSHYLDLVEVAIVRQISVRSDAFFDAMSSHDDLNDYLRKMSASIHELRLKIASTGDGISSRSLQIVHLYSKRRNNILLLEKLHTMITVHQAQPTIQLLLSTSEYAGALDLIETTQEVVKQEMAGLHCFRHLSSQLSEIQNVIGHMMKEELSRCIQIDLQRPLVEGSTAVNPHHLEAIALGLLRRKQLTFLEEFREEVKQAIKTAIKITVMDAVDYRIFDIKDGASSADGRSDDEDRGGPTTKEKTLAERMRLLEYDTWIGLLTEIFENLSIFLRRVKSFLTVIVEVICASSPTWVKQTLQEELESNIDQEADQSILPEDTKSGNFQDKTVVDNFNNYDNLLDDMDQYEERLMESVSCHSQKPMLNRTRSTSSATNASLDNGQSTKSETGASGSAGDDSTSVPNTDVLLSDEEHNEMMQSICESLAWTTDFAHDRCVKVIIAKNKNSSLDKLTSSQFLSLAQAIEKYLADTESIIFDHGETSNDAKYFAEYFSACYGNSMSGGSVLRSVLQSRASQFINRFHEERRTKLSLILDNETWKQAEVPPELSKMLQNLSAQFAENTVKVLAVNALPTASSTLDLGTTSFTVVGTVLLLLKMALEYISCADDLPNSTSDLISRVTELLTLFNSRTCQLVLGAGALQLAGLKTISTKNLGLASRCLQLVLHLLPSIKNLFEEKLVRYSAPATLSQQRKGLKHFDRVKKAYEDHIAEIDSKLVNIMDCAIENNLSKWQVKAPTPSKEFRTICRQLSKLHETIDGLLPDRQIMLILQKVHTRFRRRLQQKLQQSGVRKDGGPQCGLVMSDIAFYQENLKNLKIFKETDITMESVWA